MRATARPYPRLGTFARKEEAAIVTIPLESVEFRTGAVPDRDRVAVLDEAATKTNRKESGMQSRGGAGLDLETALAVQVRVRPAGGPSYCWMDVHVFDRMDDLITSETLPLQYVRSDDDADTEVYGFDADIFRGSGASPGSVWLAPDARRVQYRVYYETDGMVFSDGLLRQHELVADVSVTHAGAPAAPAAPVRRRRARPPQPRPEFPRRPPEPVAEPVA